MGRQGWLLIAVVTGMVGFFMLIAVMSGQGSSGIAARKFRAKPGTMRDTVLLIPSPTQERMDPEAASASTSELRGPTREKPFTIQVHSSAVAEAARQALDAPTPQVGLEQLRTYLASHHDPREDSFIQSSMAELYLRVVPPDSEAAAKAAKVAMELAQSAEERHRALYVQATVLQFQGRIEEARHQIQAAFEDDGISLAGLKLATLEGLLDEQAGDTPAAEKAYKRVMNHALSLADQHPEEALNNYRLAALKLARLYRKLGRSAEADRLATQATRQLRLKP